MIYDLDLSLSNAPKVETSVRVSERPGPISDTRYGGLFHVALAYRETHRPVLSGARTPLDRTSVTTDVDSDWELLLSPEGQKTGPHMFWEGDPIGSWLRVRIYFGRPRTRRYADRPSDQLFPIRHSGGSEALQRLVCDTTPPETGLTHATHSGMGWVHAT